jgi:hypothetical protein
MSREYVVGPELDAIQVLLPDGWHTVVSVGMGFNEWLGTMTAVFMATLADGRALSGPAASLLAVVHPIPA